MKELDFITTSIEALSAGDYGSCKICTGGFKNLNLFALELMPIERFVRPCDDQTANEVIANFTKKGMELISPRPMDDPNHMQGILCYRSIRN